MIKVLSIKNFQSHKNTEIAFHEGVNAIVGPSDSGKSAILRALRWALFNDQPGDAYRRHGSDKTTVAITIPNSAEPINGSVDYIRVRSNKDNKYVIDHELDRLEFDKVKNDVPDEIAKSFNMDDINVQRQMDAPFLLSESPAEVGRVLNRAAGIDDIDACMTKINGIALENSKELGTRTKDLQDMDVELSRYRRLPDVEAQVRVAEGLDKSLKKNREQTQDLGAALFQLGVTENHIERLELVEQLLPMLAGADKLRSRLERRTTKSDAINNVLSSLKELEAGALDEGTIGKAAALLDGTGSTAMKLGKAKGNMEALERLVSGLEDTVESESATAKKKAQLDKEYKKLMPDTCPLCDQRV